jgi:hypothetical protein
VPESRSARHWQLGLIARDLARRLGAESTVLAVQDETGTSVEVLAAWGVVAGRDGLPSSATDGFIARMLSSEEAVLESLHPNDDRLGVARRSAEPLERRGFARQPPP